MTTHDESDLQSPAHPGSGHETTDISVRPLITFVVVLVVSLAAVLIVLRGQISLYEKAQSPGQVTMEPQPPITGMPTSDPRIQEKPSLEMSEFRAKEKAELESTGWVDRQKGIAKIPVEDAMKLVVGKLPARKSQPGGKP
jgi:hypothetical protein